MASQAAPVQLGPSYDRWKERSATTTYTASRQATAGGHELKVEYYENGGAAVAKLALSP